MKAVPNLSPSLGAADKVALIGVSGGRDSVALLHWLHHQGHRRLIVCHLNHGLRGRASGQDAAFIRRLASRYGLICEVGKEDCAEHARQSRLSLETAGRDLRHRFFFAMAARHQAERIYLAHHAEDQAETILGNLCRGSGLSGLIGMQSEMELSLEGQRLWVSRPFLAWRRADIDAYVQDHRLAFREDASNASLENRRSRLRHEVLPLLNEVFGRDVTPIIARCGRLVQRDEAALAAMVPPLLTQHLAEDHSLRITPDLQALPEALFARLIRSWLVDVLELGGIDSEVIDHAMAMLKPGGPAKINLPASKHLRRRARRLWVC